MLEKNSDCILNLVQYLREHSPDDMVSFNFFITATGVEITTKHKSADDLKIEGISMKNLKGKWITENEIKLYSNKIRG